MHLEVSLCILMKLASSLTFVSVNIHVFKLLRYVWVSVVGSGFRVGASGPNYPCVGEETHAAALQILGKTRHGPNPAESALLLY